MDFFLDHAFAVAGMLLGILLLHLLEYIFRRNHKLKTIISSVNFLLHVVMIAYFLFAGAGMEELLAALLLSLAVGLVGKEA